MPDGRVKGLEAPWEFIVIPAGADEAAGAGKPGKTTTPTIGGYTLI